MSHDNNNNNVVVTIDDTSTGGLLDTDSNFVTNNGINETGTTTTTTITTITTITTMTTNDLIDKISYYRQGTTASTRTASSLSLSTSSSNNINNDNQEQGQEQEQIQYPIWYQQLINEWNCERLIVNEFDEPDIDIETKAASSSSNNNNNNSYENHIQYRKRNGWKGNDLVHDRFCFVRHCFFCIKLMTLFIMIYM
jgi:hypothetical protein